LAVVQPVALVPAHAQACLGKGGHRGHRAAASTVGAGDCWWAWGMQASRSARAARAGQRACFQSQGSAPARGLPAPLRFAGTGLEASGPLLVVWAAHRPHSRNARACEPMGGCGLPADSEGPGRARTARRRGGSARPSRRDARPRTPPRTATPGVSHSNQPRDIADWKRHASVRAPAEDALCFPPIVLATPGQPPPRALRPPRRRRRGGEGRRRRRRPSRAGRAGRRG
jgi:hypothetical protein